MRDTAGLTAARVRDKTSRGPAAPHGSRGSFPGGARIRPPRPRSPPPARPRRRPAGAAAGGARPPSLPRRAADRSKP